MAVNLNFEGMGDLIERFESMVKNSAKIESEALREAAEPIIAEARKSTAFVDRSGELRKSLQVGKVKIKSGKKYVLAGSFDDAVYYAKMVEFGRSDSKARPFLAPAFEHHKKEAEEIIIKRLKEALNEL